MLIVSNAVLKDVEWAPNIRREDLSIFLEYMWWTALRPHGLINWLYHTIYFVSSREQPWRHWANEMEIRCKTNPLIMRPSRDSFLNACENTHVTRTIIGIFLWNTRWRHGRSQGETKYDSCLNLKYFTYSCSLLIFLPQNVDSAWNAMLPGSCS